MPQEMQNLFQKRKLTIYYLAEIIIIIATFLHNSFIKDLKWIHLNLYNTTYELDSEVQ